MHRPASTSSQLKKARAPKPMPAHSIVAPAAMRLAAIDVGSNSIHMVIAQVDADGGLTTLWRLKEMVGLGRISFPSRRLSMEAMDRAVATLRRFQQEAQRRQCEKVIAVATSAVREAENGGDFVDRVRRELRLPLRVISAREEARLIYLGVRHETDLKRLDGPVLIVDVGGGSVEFIVADASRPLLLESRKLGAARMTAKFVKSDPISPEDLRTLLRHYDTELAPLCEKIAALAPRCAIGTSGTVENLAAMSRKWSSQRDEKPGSSNGNHSAGAGAWIEKDALARLLSRLLESTSKERGRMEGLDEKRQDQVVAGAVLVHELFCRLDLKRVALSRAAMREGILVDYISRHVPDLQIRREVPDPRRRSVLDLARRCDWRHEHSEHVAALCRQLFDGLRPLHGLGPRFRELIEFAAMLHDIGWHVGAKGHHKHSMYLILHGGLKGFTAEEIAIIANIARYHRKTEPSSKHSEFAKLSSKAKYAVRVGAAILRIADGLDRTHCSVIQKLRVKIGANRVQVRIEGRGDMELELWAARAKMRLFTDVFGRSLSFEPAEK